MSVEDNGIILDEPSKANGWNKLGYWVLQELKRHNMVLESIVAQLRVLSLKQRQIETDIRWYTKVSGAVSGAVTALIIGAVMLLIRYSLVN